MFMDGPTTDIPKQLCSECGYEMDATTAATGAWRPKPGDYSVCMGCGLLTQFDDGMMMRLADIALVPDHRARLEIEQVQLLIRSLRKEHPLKEGKRQ